MPHENLLIPGATWFYSTYNKRRILAGCCDLLPIIYVSELETERMLVEQSRYLDSEILETDQEMR